MSGFDLFGDVVAPVVVLELAPWQAQLFDTGELTYEAAVSADLAVFELWVARLRGDECEAARLERVARL